MDYYESQLNKINIRAKTIKVQLMDSNGGATNVIKLTPESIDLLIQKLEWVKNAIQEKEAKKCN